jgi:hypothetical protein
LATQLRSRAERAQDDVLQKHLTVTADRWDSLMNQALPKKRMLQWVLYDENDKNQESESRGEQNVLAKVGCEAAQEALSRLSELERRT